MKITSILPTSLIILCMIKDVQLIINGIPADPGDFPYIASLYKNRIGHLCCAAIIGPRYALTAAHCVYQEKESNWILRMGMVDLTDMNGEIFMVHKFHIQPDFEPKVVRKLTDQERGEALAHGVNLLSDVVMVRRPKHDLAIVEARRDFDYGLLALPLPKSQEFREAIEDLRIAVIKLAEKRPKSCAICIFVGWGNSERFTIRPSATKRLMYLMIRVHNIIDCCREACPPYTGIICAQHPARSAAPSYGDSGGPLICDGHLAGVLSNGTPDLDGADLYTDIAWYKDWIDRVINEKP